MNIKKLIRVCREHGMTFAVDGKELTVNGFTSQPTEGQVETFRKHKREIISFLKKEQRANELFKNYAKTILESPR